MIYYLCPDYDVPSWGVGMIYYHVHFLNKNGIEASIMHEKKPFRLTWLKLDVPITYRSRKSAFTTDDMIVVPDVYIEDNFVIKVNCRKILFVQNAFILFERIHEVKRLNRAGFDGVFYYMPHLQKVLSSYFSVPLFETPAFIADYYYQENQSSGQREKLILLYPKLASRDYPILQKLLKSKFRFQDRVGLKKLFGKLRRTDEWDVQVISDLSHADVAGLMKRAAFFINLNTHEAFNSSVPEAMAAGCINFTYEAYGPRDFLVHKRNAFVYNNNYIFELFEDLRSYTERFDDIQVQKQLAQIRSNALATAKQYTSSIAERELIKVFDQLKYPSK